MKLSDSIDKIKQQTRRYAKRQITWFRRCNVTDWIFLDERFDFMSFWEKIKIFLSGDLDF